MKQMNFYLVTQGEAAFVDAETEFDGKTTVLVYASSPQSALSLANMYDRNELGVDNVWSNGRAVACLSLKDRDTGEYL